MGSVGVEFLSPDASADDGPDDELDAVPRRISRPLLVILLAVVLAGSGWLALRADRSGPAAAARHATPAAGGLLAETDSSPYTGPYTGTQPAPCANRSCRFDRTIPRGLLATVRRYFPRATASSAFTVTRAGALSFRQLDARSGDVRILVLVLAIEPPEHEPVAGTDSTSTASIGYMRVDRPGFSVRVQLTGPRSWVPPMGVLNALATDSRVVST